MRLDGNIYVAREVLFAVIAIAVSIIRQGIYLWSIYKKETRPHVFSWLLWGILVGIGAFAQYQLGGGPSVWVLILVAVSCTFIAFLSFFVGEKNITRSDWISFVGAILTIVLWKTTSDPRVAIVCIVVIDTASYYPTIRKSWLDPWGEPPGSYLWAGSRYFFALFAVPEFTLDRMAYPFWLMITDWSFAIYIYWRRYALGKKGIISSSNPV